MQNYRSREVGQSYITSVGTTIIAIAHVLWIMTKIKPQVILYNGPGTCLPLCVIAFLFKVVGIRRSSTFYVESIARVRRLSLSGLLLYKLCMVDQFFGQWLPGYSRPTKMNVGWTHIPPWAHIQMPHLAWSSSLAHLQSPQTLKIDY